MLRACWIALLVVLAAGWSQAASDRMGVSLEIRRTAAVSFQHVLQLAAISLALWPALGRTTRAVSGADGERSAAFQVLLSGERGAVVTVAVPHAVSLGSDRSARCFHPAMAQHTVILTEGRTTIDFSGTIDGNVPAAADRGGRPDLPRYMTVLFY